LYGLAKKVEAHGGPLKARELVSLITTELHKNSDEHITSALGMAATKNDWVAYDELCAFAEAVAQSPCQQTSAQIEGKRFQLFVIPVLSFTNASRTSGSLPPGFDFGPVEQSLATSGFIAEQQSVTLSNYLYSPAELFELSYSQVYSLSRKILTGSEKAIQQTWPEVKAKTEPRRMLTLSYLLGTLQSPYEFEATFLDDLQGSPVAFEKMTDWVDEQFQELLLNVLNLAIPDTKLWCALPNLFYEGLREGVLNAKTLKLAHDLNRTVKVMAVSPDQLHASLTIQEEPDLAVLISIGKKSERVTETVRYQVSDFDIGEESLESVVRVLEAVGVTSYSHDMPDTAQRADG